MPNSKGSKDVKVADRGSGHANPRPPYKLPNGVDPDEWLDVWVPNDKNLDPHWDLVETSVDEKCPCPPGWSGDKPEKPDKANVDPQEYNDNQWKKRNDKKKIMRKYIILLLVINLFTLLYSFSQERERSINVEDYIVEVKPGDNGRGNVATIKDMHGKSLVLLRSDRWIELVRSPFHSIFAAIDHWDGHYATIHVFRIESNENEISPVEIYKTPVDLNRIVKWSVKKWNTNEFTFTIIRKEELPDSGRTSREFTIPLQ
ncbi:hypothetical protein JIN85_17920 [Luteolibacter pohnpeiensis]|uniref:Uncharacterized protein n=1 Tax=Luteolibacter pohnpeiensis TaxID=454153 RepID=A0A934VW65_9BACT|nr:hypothetical protein [Luteolibacter pohnpeiensis]MBK1884302.1 hypothetical protein [Luteolibacter pohnpeiensis]